MLNPSGSDICNERSSAETDGWFARSDHWASLSAGNIPTRRRRERSCHTLTITGHGALLRIEAGTLLIRNGFTHYPQQREEYRYFRGNLNRPAQIIILDGSGTITFDVLDWLSEQEIPLIRLNWKGDVTAVIGGSMLKFAPERVDWQRNTRDHPDAQIVFCQDLIRRKIRNSISTLQACIPPEKSDKAILFLQAAALSLDTPFGGTVNELRGIEGSASNSYFRAWAGLPLNWRADKRRPIPGNWLTIGMRSAIRDIKVPRNERATHPLNAILNYGYAVLLGQLRIATAADGYDPRRGIMHSSDKGSPAYLLDLMEPIRPIVDRAILQFAFSTEFHPADFVTRTDGAVRLNPQMARRVVECVSTKLPSRTSGSPDPRSLPDLRCGSAIRC